MIVDPPPTPQEMNDIYAALRHNVPEAEYLSQEVWFGQWAQYLIGLRRGYQKRFLTEAYNGQSSDT